MKHKHWSFKANTETFDGKRAVKEAYAAGLQIVSFETETQTVTLATEEMLEKMNEASIPVSVIEQMERGRAYYPCLDADGVCVASSRDEDLPPYTVSLDATADDVRGMIAQLKKPHRVAVSGYGPEVAAEAEAPEPRAVKAETPTAPFVWQGDGIYRNRRGHTCTVKMVGAVAGDSRPLADERFLRYHMHGGFLYNNAESHPCDLVGGKVADL